MDTREKVVVTIDALGRPSIEAIGFTGTACETATKGIENALAGGKAEVKKEIKPEWHEQEKAGQELHQRSW